MTNEELREKLVGALAEVADEAVWIHDNVNSTEGWEARFRAKGYPDFPAWVGVGTGAPKGDVDPRLFCAVAAFAAEQGIELRLGGPIQLERWGVTRSEVSLAQDGGDGLPLGLCDIADGTTTIHADGRLTGAYLLYVLCHELVHALHPIRDVAMAEVVAEMTGAAVALALGVDHVTHSAGTIVQWLDRAHKGGGQFAPPPPELYLLIGMKLLEGVLGHYEPTTLPKAA